MTMSCKSATRSATASGPTWIDQIARAGLFAGMRRLRDGTVIVSDPLGTEEFGSSDDAELRASVAVHDPAFYRRVAAGGSLGAAEAYLAGDWSCDDLTALFQVLIRNPQAMGGMDGGLTCLTRWFARAGHWRRRNTRAGSRSNIEAHYDLGNEFFQLFLDETMMYSSAIFPHPNSTLYEGSVEKLDRICRKLDLQPGDRVLEIGTGWGGFALHAARNYGCHVTTTTISREQYELAGGRIHDAGLKDRITLLLEDYRDLKGTYDKLVSIEMIEAVGHEHYDQFFRVCRERLQADGLMLLQGITMNEQGYAAYLRSVDFIQKYIFPGGCLPSILSLGQSVARSTDLRILQIDDYAAHYARTLRLWRARFVAALDQVRALGYSERFLRMWEYYFCYCEAAFEERYIGLAQILLAGPRSRRDLQFSSVSPAN